MLRLYQKSQKPAIFYAPTGESVGSNICNILGTNGFTRWSKNNNRYICILLFIYL
jgi:hypothetical protein